MKNIFNSIKKHKKYVFIGLGVLAVVAFFAFKNGKNGVEIFTVAEVNIEQSVMLSGKIETTDKADLGFAASGRVAKIYVKNNQAVKKGAMLAQLEIGDLIADLRIKQANSRGVDVDVQSAKDELEKVTTQQDTKVENAYRNLLSGGLVLSPASDNYGVSVPIVTGSYEGVEGQYKVIVDKENPGFADSIIRLFGLETKIQPIIKESPTTFGTKGLYLDFRNKDLASYQDTIWFLDIPNKSSSFYLPNLNAYVEAKDARDLAIKNAQAQYDKLITKGDDGSSVAQAEIEKINSEIRKNTIYAPFTGIVTNIEKEVGENASVGEQVITVLGENKLEVVMQVSELDVSKVLPNMPIMISIDALPGQTFNGILKTVNSRETKIEGVPVYEAFVELEADPRIKTGMSAKGVIVLASRDNVLAIPMYLVKKVDDQNFVEVLGADGKTEEREVTLGLVGTDSMVEVISGLSSGDKILSNEK